MAIVPIVNDVSIGDIRDIINIKAAIVGVVFTRGSRLEATATDTETGQLRVRVLNSDSITRTITVKITGDVTRNTTAELDPGDKVQYYYGGLAANTNYTVTLTDVNTGQSQTASQSIGFDGGDIDGLTLSNQFNSQNVSIAKDKAPPPTPETTSNYFRSGGINLIKNLPNTTANADLSDWRGAQAFKAVFKVKDSDLNASAIDNENGSYTLYLSSIGFSTNSVSVKVGGVTKTKVVTTSSTSFVFTGFSAGSRSCSITDLETGNTISFTLSIGTSGRFRGDRSGIIDGTDILITD